jgi:hypothetical protein
MRGVCASDAGARILWIDEIQGLACTGSHALSSRPQLVQPTFHVAGIQTQLKSEV